MTRAQLRWLLWVCLTGVAAAVAGLFGFYQLLAESDVTYLGFATLALYAACTGWLAWKIRRADRDYGFILHMAKVMSYVGILGTFIGLAVAFQSMAHLPADGSIPAGLKSEFLHGVMTKFYCSILGIVGFVCLEMQVRILETEG